MKYAVIGARILLGLVFFVFGLNGFLNFIPVPPGIPEAAMEFSAAMMKTGYFLPFVKGTEVIVGLLLLSGFFVPLALVILAPITLNILAYHLFLTPGLENAIMGIVIIGLQLFLAWHYRDRYQPLLRAK